MTPLLTGLLTGAAFGLVLYKVGASRYSRVMGMLTLRDTKIMKFAFTAVSVTSLVYGLAAVLGVAERWNLVPRVMPYLGSAHLLGGALFGVAMGSTGMCPGTCVAKTGGGKGEPRFQGLFAIVGLVLGIFAYAALKTPLTDAGIIPTNQKPITLHGLLGLPYGVVALVWGALFLSLTVIIDRVSTEKHYPASQPTKTLVDAIRGEWSWLAGGVVGGLVIVAATMQGGYLGFSGALLALVGSLAHLVGHPLDLVPKLTDDILWRAALIVGVFPGALLAKRISVPSEAAAHATVKPVFSLAAASTATAAGFGLALGAMVGGGCTTGAFIAAWSTLSVGSLAMGATFFAVGLATSLARQATHRLDLSKAQQLGDQVYD